MTTDAMHTIEGAEASAPARLRLRWSGGESVELDLADWLRDSTFAPLQDPNEFFQVELGDWGHSLEWPSGVEIGADSLWLETLSALKRDDARCFLEWRLEHGLSLTKAAEALGLSRRMVAYYSNGEKPVPRTVLLACRGWEANPAGNTMNRAGPWKRLSTISHVSMSKATGAHVGDKDKPNELFVTRREDRRYSVLRPNAQRASAVTDTQQEAIARAKEIEPDAAVHIQRVRGNPPGPDKFRKK